MTLEFSIKQMFFYTGYLLLLVASLVSLIVFMVMKARRVEQAGFLWGETVGKCPLEEAEMLFLIGVMLLFFSLMYLVAPLLMGITSGSDRDNLLVVFGLTVLIYVVLAGLIHLFFQKRGKSWGEAFGFRVQSMGKSVGEGVMGMLAIWIPIHLVAFFTLQIFYFFKWPTEPQDILKIFMQMDQPIMKIIMAGYAVIVAPVMEELLFRGLIYPALKERWGFGHALWVTSLIFAVIHQHPFSIMSLFLLSVGFILLYEWRGSLLSCMVMHASFNCLTLISALLFGKG